MLNMNTALKYLEKLTIGAMLFISFMLICSPDIVDLIFNWL